MPRSPSLLPRSGALRALALALLLLALACAGAEGAGDDVQAADAQAPDVVPELPDVMIVPGDVGAEADVASPDAGPTKTWSLVPAEQGAPATDAWLRVRLREADEDVGLLRLVLEAGAFDEVFGLALGLVFDPELVSVLEVRQAADLPAPSGGTWGVLWRQQPGRLLAGLAVRRDDDPLFGNAPTPKVSLPAATALLEIDVQVEAPGLLAFTFGEGDTAVVDTGYARVPLERLGLEVQARKGGAR